MALSFHCRRRSSMRASKRRFCSLLPTSSQYLIKRDAVIDDHVLLELGADFQEALVLLLGAEAHDMFDAGAVVPAAIEDHDFAGRREVRQVALYIHLRLLAIGGRGQRHEPKDARADALGQRADRAALAGSVAAFEDDDDPLAGRLHPVLQGAELGLQLAQLLFIFLAFELRSASISPSPGIIRLVVLRAIVMSHC